MRAVLQALVVSVMVATASRAVAQVPVGALAVDERQGDQYGWAVDYETASAAQAAALGECGAGCSVVLTFDRCGAYAADQDADSTAVGWAEAYDSAAAARAALSECRSRGGGSGCIVRVWGCNGPVVEEGLALDRSSRRQIQRGLQAGGFDPDGADGLFGPRTRAAIRNWQTSRGSRATGYLDGATAEALRTADASSSAVTQVAGPGPTVGTAAQPPASPAGAASPPASAELDGLFWQSIMNSTNPADFEAYLQQFPTGVFRALAQNRLAALRGPTGAAAPVPGARVGVAGSPGAGRRPPAHADDRGRPETSDQVHGRVPVSGAGVQEAGAAEVVATVRGAPIAEVVAYAERRVPEMVKGLASLYRIGAVSGAGLTPRPLLVFRATCPPRAASPSSSAL